MEWRFVFVYYIHTSFSWIINLIFPLLQASYIGITWATICNNQVECYDGLDERNCKFSMWLIPSLACGAAIFLSFGLSFYIHKKIKKASNKILQDRQWRLVTSQPIDKRVSKIFKIESLIHNKDSNELQNIFKTEIETHQNEGEAICYLKVGQIFVINFWVLFCLPTFEFQNFRVYWIL